MPDAVVSRRRSDFYLARTLRDAIADQVQTWTIGEVPRVVDLGCGAMPYASLIGPQTGQYTGCDLTGTGAAVEFDPGGTIPLPNGCATRVVSFQVLEHVSDVRWYLREAGRLLTDDGELLLSTHGVWPYHPHPQDFWRWTRAGLVLELERNGFEVRQVHALVGPAAWTLMFQMGAITLLCGKLGFLGRALAATVNIIGSVVLPIFDKITPVQFRETNASVYLVTARPTKVLMESYRDGASAKTSN